MKTSVQIPLAYVNMDSVLFLYSSYAFIGTQEVHVGNFPAACRPSSLAFTAVRKKENDSKARKKVRIKVQFGHRHH